MCQRFAQFRDPAAYAAYLGPVPVPGVEPDYNIFAGQRAITARTVDGQRVNELRRFGMIPVWSPDREPILEAKTELLRTRRFSLA